MEGPFLQAVDDSRNDLHIVRWWRRDALSHTVDMTAHVMTLKRDS